MTKHKLNTLQKVRRSENRVKIVQYLKSHPCIDCGESDIRVLDFDHVDPSSKTQNVTRMACASTYSWDRVKEEIDKCEIRCANCHRKKTIGEPDWFKDIAAFESQNLLEKAKHITPPVIQKHGTRYSYTFFECRCDACRKANSEYCKKTQSAYRQRKVKSVPNGN